MFLTFYKEAVECGFPSPARDFTEGTIDLNEELIPHPNATFIVRARRLYDWFRYLSRRPSHC